MSSATAAQAASCACMGPPGDCPCIRRMREAICPQPYQPTLCGWACPKCQSVYGPQERECWRCNPAAAPIVTCSSPS